MKTLTGEFVFYRSQWWRVAGYYDEQTVELSNGSKTVLADKEKVITREDIENHDCHASPEDGCAFCYKVGMNMI